MQLSHEAAALKAECEARAREVARNKETEVFVEQRPEGHFYAAMVVPEDFVFGGPNQAEVMRKALENPVRPFADAAGKTPELALSALLGILGDLLAQQQGNEPWRG